MNKKIIFSLIALFWIILLGSFIAYKEFTLQNGEKILLKTVPVDPRDLFRGDYVILNYEISTINLDNLNDNNLTFENGDTIYVALTKADNYWSASNAYKERASEFVIKGKVKNKSGSTLTVEYGIESFFVPEGEGKYLEQYRNSKELDVEVSVDSFGNSVITELYVDGKVWIKP